MVSRSLVVLDHYGLLDNATVKSVELKILCPLHEEKTPSCTVDLEREVFYCHGCGEGGSLIDLVAKLERVNKLQALGVLSRIEAGAQAKGELGIKLELPKESRIDDATARRQAREFFFSLPKPGDEDESRAVQYLRNRGFERRTIERFDIRDSFITDYPVIFPVYDSGRFAGYMTRALDDRPDKYRMSKGMRKTEILCGTVEPGKVCLLVEGFLDRARAWQNGWRNTVSSLNWSLSDTQLEKLAAASAVVCGLDNDGAGENGYQRVKDALSIPVVRYPFPSWVKDQGELAASEFRVGMDIALQRLKG